MDKKKRKTTADFPLLLSSGWEVGFEPTTHGTTIRYSNQLSYTHHLICECKSTTFFENGFIFGEKNLYKMNVFALK